MVKPATKAPAKIVATKVVAPGAANSARLRDATRAVRHAQYRRDEEFRELCWAIEDGAEFRASVIGRELARAGRELLLRIKFRNAVADSDQRPPPR